MYDYKVRGQLLRHSSTSDNNEISNIIVKSFWMTHINNNIKEKTQFYSIKLFLLLLLLLFIIIIIY